MLGEFYAGGPLDGLQVTNGFDTLLRRTVVTANTLPSAISDFYGYDNASRLTNVTDGVYSAGYGYLANSPLANSLTYRHNGTNRMTTARSYDYLNRLSSTLSSNTTPTALSQFIYQYNDANQRTRATNIESYWAYSYDTLGQVTSGRKYWPGSVAVEGQQFDYTFDDIGNRATTAAGGNAAGSSLRSASYTVNNLNQYTSRTVPNAVDIIGVVDLPSTPMVNNQTPYRRDEYYRKELSIDNSAGSVYQSVTNTATNSLGAVSNVLGNVFLPKTPESFTYDLDGNLTSDGRWTNIWDGENRLLSQTALSSVPTGAKLKVEYAYDFMGRRVQKVVSDLDRFGLCRGFDQSVYIRWLESAGDAGWEFHKCGFVHVGHGFERDDAGRGWSRWIARDQCRNEWGSLCGI